MDSDSRNLGSFSYGAPPQRMDRLEQIVIPQHSTLAQQPRIVPESRNPLDLTSAIVRELQRSNHNQQLGWQSRTPQLGGGGGGGGSEHLQLPGYGSYLVPGHNNGAGRLLPQNIRPFDETTALVPHMPSEFSTESLASAPQPGFYSRPPHLSFEDCSRSASSPWIERMMQADVTPTPAPSLGISTSLSLVQARGASQTVDFSSGLQQQQQHHKSTRGPESTVEISADLCTDEEDQDNTRPIDEKRKKRMLSNRASAQRSRHRRQERLDQLEVLTAKLRVENSTLQTKLSAAIQMAKKYEDQTKTLQKKVDKLTKEVAEGSKSTEPAAAAFDGCANSQQTTCAGSCEMVGERTSADLHGNNEASTQSVSAASPTEEVIPVRRSFSVCRVGKKRSFTELSEAGRSQANSTSFLEPRGAFATSSAFDDSAMDSLDTDRWLEFADFGLGFK